MMFIHNLTPQQQSALLHLAHKIIKADGDLHELELSLLQVLRQQSVDGAQEVAVPLADLPNLFDSERAKCSLLLELIGVAHANHEYHTSEKDLIAQYAQALNVSSEKLQALETWVEKQLALSLEAEQLLA